MSMFRKYPHIGAIFLTLLLSDTVFATNRDATPEPQASFGVVASHPEAQISATDIQAALEGVPADRRSSLLAMPSSRENFATDLLLRRIISERARAEGLNRDPLIAAQLKLAEEKLLSELYLNQREMKAIDARAIEVTAREDYRAYPERYRTDEVRVRHLLVKHQPSCSTDARQRIDELLTRIQNGEPFDEIAKKHSDDPASAAQGGDVGWFPRGRAVKPFEDAAFALTNENKLSGVIETTLGFHIIQLIDKRMQTLKPFDEVKTSNIEAARNKLRQEMRSDYIGALRQQAELKVFDSALESAINNATKPE